MRKVTFGVACSLDNFIARADHSVDWLLFGDEASALLKDLWKNIDTVLMGRGTYEVAMKQGGGGGGDTGIKTYVFSTTMTDAGNPQVDIVSDDAAAFVQRLKQGDGKEICLMGGGRLAQSLFEAGVIDEVGLNIHPVLLGSGIPLFLDMKRQIDLELVEAKPFKNGCVYVSYRVKRAL